MLFVLLWRDSGRISPNVTLLAVLPLSPIHFSLSCLYLDNNALTGDIPAELGQLGFISVLFLSTSTRLSYCVCLSFLLRCDKRFGATNSHAYCSSVLLFVIYTTYCSIR